MVLDDILEKHEKMLYPTVRVTYKDHGGSGTTIYSEKIPGKEDLWGTYILTNEHVIDKAISVKKECQRGIKRNKEVNFLIDRNKRIINGSE